MLQSFDVGGAIKWFAALGCVFGAIIGIVIYTTTSSCLGNSDRGEEGQACFANQTCMDDLKCRSGLCVQLEESDDK